jgi:hypothetical protein
MRVKNAGHDRRQRRFIVPQQEDAMTDDGRIVAIVLVTRPELDRLGAHFKRVYPVTDVPCFGELLTAIDDADRVARVPPPRLA